HFCYLLHSPSSSFSRIRPPPTPTLFPYTTLFRSVAKIRLEPFLDCTRLFARVGGCRTVGSLVGAGLRLDPWPVVEVEPPEGVRAQVGGFLPPHLAPFAFTGRCRLGRSGLGRAIDGAYTTSSSIGLARCEGVGARVGRTPSKRPCTISETPIAMSNLRLSRPVRIHDLARRKMYHDGRRPRRRRASEVL